jgi:hypothetical protein
VDRCLLGGIYLNDGVKGGGVVGGGWGGVGGKRGKGALSDVEAEVFEKGRGLHVPGRKEGELPVVYIATLLPMREGVFFRRPMILYGERDHLEHSTARQVAVSPGRGPAIP